MIELVQFTPAFGLMNASPFCMKVEVFLRLAGLPYRAVNGAMPMRTPKGKLPVLRDDGQTIADSEAIIGWLQKRHGESMPAAMREAVTGPAHAVRRMVEEHTYFAMLWLRWIDDAGFTQTRTAFFGDMPPLLRTLVPALIRRKMRRDLVGQGTGRHGATEIAMRACADLDALAAALGEAPYFGGGEPGAIDATTYAFLANALWAPIDNLPRRHLQEQASLVDYCKRMRERIGA
jgi:glutathione S-transferase